MVDEEAAVTHQPAPNLKGKKNLSGLFLWLSLPLWIGGGIRVAIHLSERFQESTESGLSGIVSALCATASICGIAVIVAWQMERVFWKRARAASGSTELIPMCLGLDSFQQAYDAFGKVAFLPSRHEGVLLAFGDESYDLYAGYGHYEHPLLQIPYARVDGLRKVRVDLPVGKEPGVVFETVGGPFALGFVRSAAFRGRKTPVSLADSNFERLEHALEEWRSQQARESNSGLQA